MLAVGQKVPPFAGPSTKGPLSSEALSGRPYVVYFFPKAFTPG